MSKEKYVEFVGKRNVCIVLLFDCIYYLLLGIRNYREDEIVKRSDDISEHDPAILRHEHKVGETRGHPYKPRGPYDGLHFVFD